MSDDYANDPKNQFIESILTSLLNSFNPVDYIEVENMIKKKPELLYLMIGSDIDQKLENNEKDCDKTGSVKCQITGLTCDVCKKNYALPTRHFFHCVPCFQFDFCEKCRNSAEVRENHCNHMKVFGTIFQIYHNYYLKKSTHFKIQGLPFKKHPNSKILGCLPFQKSCPEKQESSEVLLSKLFGYAIHDNIGGFQLFLQKQDNQIHNQRCLNVKSDMYKFCDVIRIIKWKMTENQMHISCKFLDNALGSYYSVLNHFFQDCIKLFDLVWISKLYIENHKETLDVSDPE